MDEKRIGTDISRKGKGNKSGIPGEDIPLVIFDGLCNLCSFSVSFILRRERSHEVYFKSLQSPGTEKYLHGIKPEDYSETIIFIEKGKIYYKSSAVLRIAAKLKYPWRLFSVFIFLPEFIRDPIYMLIARNRYRWFGKKDVCFIPEEPYHHRFI